MKSTSASLAKSISASVIAIVAELEPVKPAPRKTAAKTPARKAASETAQQASVTGLPSMQEVQQMIAAAAYYRAQKRGFATGSEQEDGIWRNKKSARCSHPERLAISPSSINREA